MQGCFSLLVVIAGFLLVALSIIRWVEQATLAVEQGRWDRVALLAAFPFAAWFYPSRVSAGRPVAVPRHVPTPGRGAAPATTWTPQTMRAPRTTLAPATPQTPPDDPPPPAQQDAAPPLHDAEDAPPPGTPAAFLVLPTVPPKANSPRSSIDPEKIEQLRRKMREQGMIE